MQLPINFESMSPERLALEVARHELVTCNGLIAFDNDLDFSIVLDKTAAINLIDMALVHLDKP